MEESIDLNAERRVLGCRWAGIRSQVFGKRQSEEGGAAGMAANGQAEQQTFVAACSA